MKRCRNSPTSFTPAGKTEGKRSSSTRMNKMFGREPGAGLGAESCAEPGPDAPAGALVATDLGKSLSVISDPPIRCTPTFLDAQPGQGPPIRSVWQLVWTRTFPNDPFQTGDPVGLMTE